MRNAVHPEISYVYFFSVCIKLCTATDKIAEVLSQLWCLFVGNHLLVLWKKPIQIVSCSPRIHQTLHVITIFKAQL